MIVGYLLVDRLFGIGGIVLNSFLGSVIMDLGVCVRELRMCCALRVFHCYCYGCNLAVLGIVFCSGRAGSRSSCNIL